MPFSIFCVQARLGQTFPIGTGLIKPLIIGIIVGPSAVSGGRCLRPWRRPVKIACCLSIARLSKPTARVRGRVKKGSTGRTYRQLTRRSVEQGSRGGKCARIAHKSDDYGRSVHDAKAAEDFLDWPDDPLAIVADKAYSSKRIRRAIADHGALAVIPTKSNARHPIMHDKNLYAMRHKVECFFARLKDMRRLATRFEKRARNFIAMVHLYCIRMYLN